MHECLYTLSATVKSRCLVYFGKKKLQYKDNNDIVRTLKLDWPKPWLFTTILKHNEAFLFLDFQGNNENALKVQKQEGCMIHLNIYSTWNV